jgi:hypothetical protein
MLSCAEFGSMLSTYFPFSEKPLMPVNGNVYLLTARIEIKVAEYATDTKRAVRYVAMITSRQAHVCGTEFIPVI